MPEQRIDSLMLQRFDGELQATREAVGKIDARISNIEQKVARIEGENAGASKPRSDVHWTIRYVVAPLLVVLIGGLGAFFFRSIDQRLQRLESLSQDNTASIAGLRLQANAANPKDQQTIWDTTHLLTKLESAKVKIPSQTLVSAGVKFISATTDHPDSWEAVLAFLDYRSFLNADFEPAPKPFSPSRKTNYQQSVTFKPNPEHPEWHKSFTVVFAGGEAPLQLSARLESFDRPQPEGSGVAYFLIEGALDTIVLDGMYMRHVIIRNADVEYDGQPTRLEDVYFVNCTFRSRFKLNPDSQKLSREILVAKEREGAYFDSSARAAHNPTVPIQESAGYKQFDPRLLTISIRVVLWAGRPAFDLVDTTKTVGAPLFALFEGRVPRVPTTGDSASHPHGIRS
jgi:hypothetical protein